MRSTSSMCVRSFLLLAALFGASVALAGTKGYVPNFNGHDISVIDTATQAVVATITTGGLTLPAAAAVSPDGSRAYVVGDSVWVIDGATDTIAATVPPGGNSLAISPDGATLYMAFGGPVLAVFDTATQTVTGFIPTGSPVTDIGIAPDGARLFVTSQSGNNVTVIDTASSTVIATIAGVPSATGIAITPDGTAAYVTSNNFPNPPTDTVTVIDTASNTVSTSITVGQWPSGIDISLDGATAYVANFDGTVSVISTASNTVTNTVPVGTGGLRFTVAMGPDGSLVYIANFFVGTVSVIDTATETLTTTITAGQSPSDIAFPRPQSQSPQDQIASLIADINALVAGGDLAANKAAPMINKLDQILGKLAGGQTAAACNQLDAFSNQVNAYVNSATLTAAEGQSLIDAVNALQSDLGC